MVWKQVESVSLLRSHLLFLFLVLVLSSPHLCLRFPPTWDACSLLKALRISMHCFLKLWVRSSANKLHKCAWFPTPGYSTCFPQVREVTTLILSLCGDIVLPGRSVVLSHPLTRLYSPSGIASLSSSSYFSLVSFDLEHLHILSRCWHVCTHQNPV